jgi:GDP-D-mannose dehydratase
MASMVRQEEPDDYMIASGVGHSVRELVELAFATRFDDSSYDPGGCPAALSHSEAGRTKGRR